MLFYFIFLITKVSNLNEKGEKNKKKINNRLLSRKIAFQKFQVKYFYIN